MPYYDLNLKVEEYRGSTEKKVGQNHKYFQSYGFWKLSIQNLQVFCHAEKFATYINLKRHKKIHCDGNFWPNLMCNTILESFHSVELYKNMPLDTFDFLLVKYLLILKQNLKYIIFKKKNVFY